MRKRAPKWPVAKALIFESSTENLVVADQSGDGIGGWPTWQLPVTRQARAKIIIEAPWYVRETHRRRR